MSIKCNRLFSKKSEQEKFKTKKDCQLSPVSNHNLQIKAKNNGHIVNYLPTYCLILSLLDANLVDKK